MSNSIGFDESFYLSRNPDVAAAISRGIFTSGAQHFELNGRFEGRNPNAFFDTSFYLGTYPDVARAGVNPLTHFLNNGAAEGRFSNLTEQNAIDLNGNGGADDFDNAQYLADYPDVAAAVSNGTFTNGYQHFVQFGQFEGRTAVLSNGATITGPFTNSGVAPGTGSTITLTTGVDNLTGTGANDTFTSTIGNGGTSTLQSGDTINGGAGNDTLRIVASNTAPSLGNLNGSGPQTVIPTLTNVENITYQGFTSSTNTLNLANSSGVRNVTLDSGNSSLNLTNVAQIVGLGASNTTGGTLTATYNAAAIAGSSDVQAISLDNATGTTINANGVETINLTVTGTNGTASGTAQTGANSITGNGITTVNVSGAGSVVLGTAFAATTTTFDASQNTGGVNATFTAGGNVTVTGGSGNDVFNFGAGLTATAGTVAGDVVNGGEGFDTVRVTTGGDLSAAADAAPFNGLVSIERVAFDGNGVTLNGATFTNTGITNIEFNTAGLDTINNAGSARTYEFGAANTGDAAFNMTAGATTLNIDLQGTTGLTAVTGANNTVEVGALTITPAGVASATNVTSITLSSLGNFTASSIANDGGTLGLTAGSFNSVGEITAASGSTLTLDGNAALDIASSTSNITINASALTGSLIVQGSAFAGAEGTVATEVDGDPAVNGVATATTQTGVDVITLGSARSVVQFAADGFDSGIIQITGTAANAAANGNVYVDIINNFTAGAGGDVLDILDTAAGFTALAAETQTAINSLSGADATLFTAANTAALANTAAGWTAFSFQGNTYALYEGIDNGTDDNGALATNGFTNADTLVQLTGVTVASLTADNFA